MNRVKFIYNPMSVNRKVKDNLDTIIEKYQNGGYIIELHRIGINDNLEKLFEDNTYTYDHILISGGDGTIDSVVNIMKSKKINLPIGILPTGTANDFANMLNISNDINQALENILLKRRRSIDLGKINDKYFINVASAGMFSDVSQRINNDLKNSLGKISYYIKGIEEAMNMKSFNISVKSEIDDGLLDVIIFKEMPLPQSLHMLIKVIRQEHLEQEEIIYFRTKKVDIYCEDYIAVDIDGEQGPDFPLCIECKYRQVDILA